MSNSAGRLPLRVPLVTSRHSLRLSHTAPLLGAEVLTKGSDGLARHPLPAILLFAWFLWIMPGLSAQVMYGGMSDDIVGLDFSPKDIYYRPTGPHIAYIKSLEDLRSTRDFVPNIVLETAESEVLHLLSQRENVTSIKYLWLDHTKEETSAVLKACFACRNLKELRLSTSGDIRTDSHSEVTELPHLRSEDLPASLQGTSVCLLSLDCYWRMDVDCFAGLARLASLKSLSLFCGPQRTESKDDYWKSMAQGVTAATRSPSSIASIRIQYLATVELLAAIAKAPGVTSLAVEIIENFSGPMVQEIAKSKSLQSLYFQAPSMDVVALGHLKKCEQLRALGFDRTLSASPAEVASALSDIKQLRTLFYSAGQDRSAAELRGADLVKLAELPHLESLTLRHHRKLGADLDGVLAKFPSLRRLHIHKTTFTPAAVAALTACGTLQELALFDCPGIGDEALHAIAAMPHLTSLAIVHDHLNVKEQVTDASLRSLGQRAKGLKALYFYSPNIMTDEGLLALAPLKHLQSLTLWGGANITGKGLGAFAKASSVTRLALASKNLTADDHAEFGKFASLRELIIPSYIAERLYSNLRAALPDLTVRVE